MNWTRNKGSFRNFIRQDDIDWGTENKVENLYTTSIYRSSNDSEMRTKTEWNYRYRVSYNLNVDKVTFLMVNEMLTNNSTILVPLYFFPYLIEEVNNNNVTINKPNMYRFHRWFMIDNNFYLISNNNTVEDGVLVTTGGVVGGSVCYPVIEAINTKYEVEEIGNSYIINLEFEEL